MPDHRRGNDDIRNEMSGYISQQVGATVLERAGVRAVAEQVNPPNALQALDPPRLNKRPRHNPQCGDDFTGDMASGADFPRPDPALVVMVGSVGGSRPGSSTVCCTRLPPATTTTRQNWRHVPPPTAEKDVEVFNAISTDDLPSTPLPSSPPDDVAEDEAASATIFSAAANTTHVQQLVRDDSAADVETTLSISAGRNTDDTVTDLGSEEHMALPSGSCVTCPSYETEDADKCLAFAMGGHVALGQASFVHLLNDQILRSILLCEIKVGPTRHYTSLKSALESPQAACSAYIRIELEDGEHEASEEAAIPRNSRVVICAARGAHNVVVKSTTGSPCFTLSHACSVVTAKGITFTSACQSLADKARSRTIGVSAGMLLLTSCTVSSGSGIGVCVVRGGEVHCKLCNLEGCRFVGLLAAQKGKATISRSRVAGNGHFGVLSTDQDSLVVIQDSVLEGNAVYGAGAGSGGEMVVERCRLSRNQIGLVSKGGGSLVRGTACDVLDNSGIGVGVRDQGEARVKGGLIMSNHYGVCVHNGSKIALSGTRICNSAMHGLGVSEGGHASAQDCQMSRNQVGVVCRGVGSKVSLTRCKANGNRRIGLGVREGGAAECGSCEMDGNQYGVCCLNEGTSLTMNACSASRNGRYGASSSDGGLVEAMDCVLSSNMQLGVGSWHTSSKVMLLRCVAEGNGRTGLAARLGSSIAAVETVLKGNEQFGVHVSGQGSSATLLGCQMVENGMIGIGSSERGTTEATDCSIAANGKGGVVAKDEGSLSVLRGCRIIANGCVGVGVRAKGAVQAVGCMVEGNGRSDTFGGGQGEELKVLRRNFGQRLASFD